MKINFKLVKERNKRVNREEKMKGLYNKLKLEKQGLRIPN